MIKMTHVVACSMVFIVLSNRGWLGEVLNLMKNETLWKTYSFWVGKEVFYIIIIWSDKSATCSSLLKCFSFLLWSRLVCRIADTCECTFDPVANHIAFDENQESVFYSLVPNLLRFILGSKATGKSDQT